MLRRSNSRAGMTRSNSVRSVSSVAESNASKSAAAAAASALANAQRRNSIEPATAARPVGAPALQRRASNASLASNVTSASNRPGQYSAVRQTGSRRLYGNNNNATIAANTAATSKPTVRAGETSGRQTTTTHTSHLRDTLRSKPPTVASTQRRQQNMSSSASIRSFQSDLERINEDYNKTYAYAGQTSASAMRAAAPVSARGRRAESVISSAMSDTSEAPQAPDAVARRKASRVSFSDVDENEATSRNPSPNPERRKSALKQAPASRSDGHLGRGAGLMPPPALQRRGSNTSINSNVSGRLGRVPELAAPISKASEVPSAKAPKNEDGDLSTIASNSAYSDADEDFKASPALQRYGVSDSTAPSNPPLQLTQQNLAAVTGSDVVRQASPIKSAMRKTPSVQSGSARFSRLETDSQIDVADNESDDSFAARRKAKKIAGRKSLTTLRSEPRRDQTARFAGSTNGDVVKDSSGSNRPAPVRTNSISSQLSTRSQEPTRMTSLRERAPQSKRQSMQTLRSSSYEKPPALSRRTSMQSVQSVQPPLPPKSARRASVAGSVAESVRSDAVTNHIAVMSIAQQRVQRLLHPDAVDSPQKDMYGDAQEPKKSSFERKRPSGLTRQHSSSSMIDRSFRNTLRPESEDQRATHRRAASDDRAFATTLRGDRPRPVTQRSSSMIITTNQETRSMPATPKRGARRRMSFGFGRSRDKEDTPAVPIMRRYSSDSEPARPSTRNAPKGALKAGTLRSESQPTAGARPGVSRYESDISVSKKTGKPKKFQALRRLFKIRD